MDSPEVETSGSPRPAGPLFFRMGLIGLIFFMLACSTINIGVKVTQVPTLRTSPIKQLIIGPEGGEVSIPQGTRVIIPAGALADDVDVNISQVIDGVQIPGGLQALGAAYGISISDPNRLNGTVDILLPLSQPVDPSRGQVVVYKFDGKEWTDIGGSVEGKSIRVSVKTFSIFIPAQTAFPHRPIGFVNSGQWHAVVMPATWVIDPKLSWETVQRTNSSPEMPAGRHGWKMPVKDDLVLSEDLRRSLQHAREERQPERSGNSL